MPHHPCASPASPASPSVKSWGSLTGKPQVDMQPRIQSFHNGVGVGAVLTLIPGSWRGATPITLTYQWTRDGANIAGATAANYTLVAADVPGHSIACIETATNSAGATSVRNYTPAHT